MTPRFKPGDKIVYKSKPYLITDVLDAVYKARDIKLWLCIGDINEIDKSAELLNDSNLFQGWECLCTN